MTSSDPASKTTRRPNQGGPPLLDLQQQANYAGSPRAFHLTPSDAIRDALLELEGENRWYVRRTLEEALRLLGEVP